jgi:Phytanoyl-CoA dioxygenase (PhyH)
MRRTLQRPWIPFPQTDCFMTATLTPLFNRDCLVNSKVVPQERLGELKDSTPLLADPVALRKQLQQDGYLYLKGIVKPQHIEAARQEVFARLAEMGELKEPAHEGIFSGVSHRDQRVSSRGEFWQSVSEGPHLRHLTHGEDMHRVMDLIMGEKSRPHDYLFLRAGVQGRSTGLHYDYPFFTRAHDQVYTVWMPIGNVPVEQGPLAIVEGSKKFKDLIDPMNGFDVALDKSRKATLSQDALSLATERNTRLLSRNFEIGDIVVFGMYTLHGAFQNHCPLQKVRLSCDVRWQPAALDVDARYFGKNPGGTTGAGYGELQGAKPLTDDWHVR